jgi:hypothetical protein
MNRLMMYRTEEQLAVEKYECEREGCQC